MSSAGAGIWQEAAVKSVILFGDCRPRVIWRLPAGVSALHGTAASGDHHDIDMLLMLLLLPVESPGMRHWGTWSLMHAKFCSRFLLVLIGLSRILKH